VSAVVAPEAAARSDLRVERIGTERADDWASILVPAFAYPDGAADWLAATVGRPGWHHYLALDGDAPAATAALFVSGSLGSLNFAATRPEFRRRGAQSVLIARRIEDAREMGLDWLVTETDEELPERPNPSYHNVERAGMPARYVRTNWGPPPPQ
jgi:GNAT superfamily N-acetyltransferase